MHRTRLARWHMWIACRNHKLLKHFGWVSLSSQYTSLAHPVEAKHEYVCHQVLQSLTTWRRWRRNRVRHLGGSPATRPPWWLAAPAPRGGDQKRRCWKKKRRGWEMTEKKEGAGRWWKKRRRRALQEIRPSMINWLWQLQSFSCHCTPSMTIWLLSQKAGRKTPSVTNRAGCH